MTLIQSVLRKSTNASKLDQLAFNEYCEGVITLQECKERFINNNKIPKEKYMLITDEEFEKWLKSLGYKK